MSTKKIYLVRHGQTDYNKQGIVQGSGVDSNINEKGQQQANAFFEYYKNVDFDYIYTSKLKRSKQSVQQFIDLGIPHTSLAELNEICWGKREGEKITPEEDKYYHWVLDEWKKGNVELPIEGGESPLEVQKKQEIALKKILKRTSDKNILICMHGRAIRIFLSLLLKTPLKEMDQYQHQNLCLYLLEYKNDKFNLLKTNNIDHLK